MTLPESDVMNLVDCLRRNLLYQTPEIILGAEDEMEPRAVVCRILPDDYFAVLELIRKAGGWDLSGEQKERLATRSIEDLNNLVTLGTVTIDTLDPGTLLWIIERTEHDLTYAQLCDSAKQELARRSEAD